MFLIINKIYKYLEDVLKLSFKFITNQYISKKKKSYLFSSFSIIKLIFTINGYLFNYMISPFMLTGKKAIIYYGLAHLSQFNSWVHTFVMPITIFGMLIWLSALLKLNPKMAKLFMWSLYYFYC